MSVVEDVRTVIQDFLAPELRELKARVEALEKRMDDRFKHVDDRFDLAERTAHARHEQVMHAIQQLTDYTTLAQRVARLESRESAH
jgi:capsule polysaccharide export protein KpsE/RkpR